MVISSIANGRTNGNAKRMNFVVKLTNSIDTRPRIAHRKSNAAAFGMCAGLAIPTVTHMKGGK